eukprot:gnl/TRDRNA2_/TRDRNA2_63813_c0_seq1.p1 gnl/TRDRNA2_/TRDRNA2_63813_c0~~gnl/TRDRNA2_/TRDRNA2_63813_c0_seq1.p1  ORF type:complete len:326 (+),score=39.06 gnl/TRDRNA2_/TRDRNA2_63813_c0_seq1:34-978(+)
MMSADSSDAETVSQRILSPHVLGYIQMLLSTTSFAAMAAVSKAIGPGASSLEKIFWRSWLSIAFTLAGHCTGMTAAVGKPKRPLLMLLRGLCGLVALWAYMEAIERLPLADATFLGKIHPLAAAALAWMFIGESLHPARIVAICTSFVGIAFISRPSADGFSSSRKLLGVALGLGAGLLSGAAYVCVRALARAGEAEFWILLAFPVVSLPFCAYDAWLGVAERGIDGRLLILFVALGVATQGGQVFLARGLAAVPAAHGTQIMYFGTVIGVLFGVLLGDPWPSWNVWVGGGIICASMQMAEVVEKAQKLRSKTE